MKVERDSCIYYLEYPLASTHGSSVSDILQTDLTLLDASFIMKISTKTLNHLIFDHKSNPFICKLLYEIQDYYLKIPISILLLWKSRWADNFPQDFSPVIPIIFWKYVSFTQICCRRKFVQTYQLTTQNTYYLIYTPTPLQL